MDSNDIFKYKQGIKLGQSFTRLIGYFTDKTTSLEKDVSEMEDVDIPDTLCSELDVHFWKPLQDERNYISYSKETIDVSVDHLLSKLKKVRTKRRLYYLKSFSAVACVIVALSMWFHYNTKVEPMPVLDYMQPILIIDNQAVILLDTINARQLINPKKELITAKHCNPMKQEIITPAGKTYKMVLNDGSEILLNACSRISYYIHPNKRTREVTIVGEAYFQIKPDSIPFVIHNKDHRIKVYGTEFNVKSYQDESMELLLIKGSLGVSGKDEVEVMLQPNQLYTKQGNDKYILTQVDDTSMILSWISGRFKYMNIPIDVIFRDLERWYGIAFKGIDKINAERITLVLSQRSSLEEMLSLLEELLNIKIEHDKDSVYMIQKK